MKRFRALLSAFLLPPVLLSASSAQQSPPAAIQFQGLRSINHQGSLQGAAFTPDGNLVLLYNQGDGLRLLKTDPQAQTLLAQVQLGAAGDSGVALATDPSGNLYVAGTSSSGSLLGTAGAVFLTPADTSINSFLAKFDPNLNLLFLTFLGASHTAATAVAATADAAFVTGSTYSTSLPTTPTAAQPNPALGSDGNGFVQRFSPDGTTLAYSTYLTGTGGSTAPTSIVADSADNTIIAGSTSAPGFPTTSGALQPVMLGPVAGFLAKMTPGGDSFLHATFLAGSGVSSLALDPGSGNLFATANISAGDFPLTTATAPIANDAYQSLLRLSPDGQTLLDSVLLLPGSHSAVTPGPGGTAWITGSLGTPPFANQDAASLGDSYLIHLTAGDVIDQVFRLGGSSTQNPGYAYLTSTPSAAVLHPSGTLLIVPSTLAAQTDPSFINTQTFDLSLAGNTPSLLPNSVRDLLPSQCSTGLPCSGSAAFLSAFSTTAVPSALSLSTGDLPALILRNPGTASAANLSFSAPGSTLTSNCPQTLLAASQCTIALSDSTSSTLSVTSSTSPLLSISVPSTTSTPQSLAFDTAELDFGIVTHAGSPATRTVTITNLSPSSQTFDSTADDPLTNSPFTLAETASTCQGPPQAHLAPANGSCTVTLGLSASASSSGDGPVRSAWKLGDRDLTVTAFTQAASLALSSSLLDFGIQTPGSSIHLPRFLYLSNSSPRPLDHAPLSLPSNSPFTLTDNCPSTLQPNTVCQIRFAYTQTAAPTLDSFTLTLDGGSTVLLEGETAAAASSLASFLPSPLVVSPSIVQFSSAVLASETSSEVETVQVTNPTQAAIPLTASVLGDFALQNTCSATLPPGASCTLGLQFTPSQSGAREGLLTLSAGSNVQPINVPISGTATPLLTPADTTVEFGQTSVAEPVVHWMQVQGTLPQLTAVVSGSSFAVSLLPDDGNGHGTLPPTAFASSASAQCVACWLAIQFLPNAAGDFTARLQLTTDPSGMPTTLALHGTATPTQGLLLTPAGADFAAVAVGSTAAATTFTLTNLLPGAPTLHLQSIATAGDFTVLPATSPFACAGSLPPAASCRMDIAFAPTAQGLRAGVLTVATSGGSATAPLTGTGTPDPGLALNPTTLTFSASHSNATLTITNTGPDVITFSPLVSSDPAFTVATRCNSLSPGQSCTATVSLTGNPASNSSLLTFTFTSPNTAIAAQSGLYAVPLQTFAPQPVMAFPTQADFGAQPTNSPGALRQFEIVNTSASPETLAITSSRNFPLSSRDPCPNFQPGIACTFSAIFLPQEAGPLTGEITITPSTPDGGQGIPTLIYLQGYGVGTGNLIFSLGTAPDNPLHFDQVNSGQSASRSLTVTNAGTVPASLRRLTSTAPFGVSSNPCPPTLPPAASCSLTVLYSPVLLESDTTSQSVRTDTGTLLFETDDPASPTTVYLTGAVASTSTAPSSTPVALPTYTLSQSALTFPNTLGGQPSAAQTILVTNSGTVPVVFDTIAASSDFAASSTCATLQPGTACTLTAVFTPDTSSKNATISGTLALGSNAATATDFITLLGPSFQTPLAASPSSLTFSPVLVGSSAPLTVTVTNITGLPLLLSQPSSQGDFAITGGTCATIGGTLAPGASCTYIITFTPTAPGTRTGALTVPAGASAQPLTVPLQGAAVAGQLHASPDALNFGPLNLTASATQTLILTNTGTATLASLALSLSGPNASDFNIASACAPTLPLTGVCTVQVTFTPSASGSRAATLAIASSDPTSPTLVALTGTGAQPPAIVLTVNGSSAASATIASGAIASFGLTLTPQGGFTSGVALACTPVTPAPNTVCSLSDASVASLDSPVQSTALLTTEDGYAASPFAITLLGTLPWAWRRRRRRHDWPPKAAILAVSLLLSMLLASCAGGPGTTGNPYTPPGSYLYQVTATSTSGPPLRSTVTLALTVQ